MLLGLAAQGLVDAKEIPATWGCIFSFFLFSFYLHCKGVYPVTLEFKVQGEKNNSEASKS